MHIFRSLPDSQGRITVTMLRKISVSISVSSLFFTALAGAAEQNLSEIEVTEERYIAPTRQMDETVYTGSEISKKGIELQGSKAKSSVYEAVSQLPGITYENSDSCGLAVEQGSFRSRGVKGMLGALTVEGIPSYGGNPIGPRDYLYDLENISGIAVYKGAVPADLGTGVGSRGGAIVLHPDWPHQKPGGQISQGVGSRNYHRTFLRLDSGALPVTQTQLSGSYSFGQADKWRGAGELGPRHNFNLALSQQLGSNTDLKLSYNYNSIDQDLYRPLTFAETRDLKANYRKDYNVLLTGNATDDINYYKYNHGRFINRDFMAILNSTPLDNLRLTLKPYYSVEDTEILQGNAANKKVQKRTRDIERGGFIAESSYGTEKLKGVLGYHFEVGTMNIYNQNYDPKDGGLDYKGYGVFGSSGTNYINSPYLKFSGKIDRLSWQVGLKYFNYAEAASKGYTSSPSDFALNPAADLDRKSRRYDIWLPTVGASYEVNDNIQLHASYGRNFIRPYSYMPLVNAYNNNRNDFKQQGITLNNLFNGYKMEESDDIDFGIRYRGDVFEIAPTFFFGWHRNLLTTVSDPRVMPAGNPVRYQQNIAKAIGYGIDTEISAYITDYLTVFANPTWTRLTYDGDAYFQGVKLAGKGRQVVDTPEWMLKTGLILKLGDFEIVPKLRFIGDRYGDLEHKERIGSYTVADLAINYTRKNIWRMAKLKAGLELTNLTDRRYVAVINSADDARAGSTSYYQGAPFTAIATVGVEF